jgi:hypothetical protein
LSVAAEFQPVSGSVGRRRVQPRDTERPLQLRWVPRAESFGTIFKELPSASNKDCWPLLIQKMASFPEDPVCQAELTPVVNVQAARFDAKTAASRLPLIKAGLIKQTFSNIEMTLDFVLNVFAVKKHARQSLEDFELALQSGMHFSSGKFFCRRIDQFNRWICVAPIVIACDTQKSNDLVGQFLMVLWKSYGAEFRELFVGKMKELFAKSDLQPNGQLSVLAVICKFVIGTHGGLQDELTEVVIEMTTKQPNDWLQGLELALREVQAPESSAQFVVNSGAFLPWEEYESDLNMFNKVVARMSLEEVKEFIMKRFGEERPSNGT